MINPVLLFRELPEFRQECKIAAEYFPCYKYRTDIPANSLVIPRYSAQPYFYELEYDLKQLGSAVINTAQMHRWIANFEYYETIQSYTARSWNEEEIPYLTHLGPFIVKGASRSLKMLWNTHMFAKDRRDLIQVLSKVRQDSGLTGERIIIREFLPLKTFEIGLNALPFTNEWRLFFYKTTLIGSTYYWEIASDETLQQAQLTSNGLQLATEVAQMVQQYSNFFVLDIAEKENGDWVVIEINDGMQAGLQGLDAHLFYKNLQQILSK